jgi:hypothetical protein
VRIILRKTSLVSHACLIELLIALRENKPNKCNEFAFWCKEYDSWSKSQRDVSTITETNEIIGRDHTKISVEQLLLPSHLSSLFFFQDYKLLSHIWASH